MQADGNWCGTATGSVVSPLNLDLAGSTFAAQPWTDGIELDSIPFKCPGDPCAPDVGVPEMDKTSRATLGFNGPSSIHLRCRAPHEQI